MLHNMYQLKRQAGPSERDLIQDTRALCINDKISHTFKWVYVLDIKGEPQEKNKKCRNESFWENISQI